MIVQPSIVDKILDLEVIGILELYFPSDGQTKEGVILIIFVSESINPNHLSVKFLVFKFFFDLGPCLPEPTLFQFVPELKHPKSLHLINKYENNE